MKGEETSRTEHKHMKNTLNFTWNFSAVKLCKAHVTCLLCFILILSTFFHTYCKHFSLDSRSSAFSPFCVSTLASDQQPLTERSWVWKGWCFWPSFILLCLSNNCSFSTCEARSLRFTVHRWDRATLESSPKRYCFVLCFWALLCLCIGLLVSWFFSTVVSMTSYYRGFGCLNTDC